MDAQDVVRDPRLWRELAKTLRSQADFVANIGSAIEANDFEAMKRSLIQLTGLVKLRQPLLMKLAPAIEELVNELFADEREDP